MEFFDNYVNYVVSMVIDKCIINESIYSEINDRDEVINNESRFLITVRNAISDEYKQRIYVYFFNNSTNQTIKIPKANYNSYFEVKCFANKFCNILTKAKNFFELKKSKLIYFY
jgi:hypothetical protein